MSQQSPQKDSECLDSGTGTSSALVSCATNALLASLLLHSCRYHSNASAAHHPRQFCLIPPPPSPLSIRPGALGKSAPTISASRTQQESKKSLNVALGEQRVSETNMSVASVNDSSSADHEPTASVGPAPSRDESRADGLPDTDKARRNKIMMNLMRFVKAGDAAGALRMYDAVKELGCRPTEDVFNAVLRVCGDGNWVSRGKGVLTDMQAASLKPQESSYVFLLREAAGRGCFDEAFSILRNMTDRGLMPRLRSYAPVFRGLCYEPNMPLASEVWAHMRENGVQPAEEDYVLMIRGWAKSNELWHRVRDGSVDRLLRELSDTAFELSSTAGIEPSIAARGVISPTINFLETLMMAFNSSAADGSDLTATPCARVATVRSELRTGVCDCCGGRLRAVGLSENERFRVRSALKDLATKSTLNGIRGEGKSGALEADGSEGWGVTEEVERGYGEGEGGRTGGEGVVDRMEGGSGVAKGYGGESERWRGVAARAPSGDLDHFAGWLETRRKEGTADFTTVIDGCNVAYFGQNVEGGQFQMLQVDQVVRLLEAKGERVLVILPERYLRPVVTNSSRFKGAKNAPTRLSAEALEAVEDWEERGILYKCLDGADDDLFWMYFTVASSTSTEAGVATSEDGQFAVGSRSDESMDDDSLSRGSIGGDAATIDDRSVSDRSAAMSTVSGGGDPAVRDSDDDADVDPSTVGARNRAVGYKSDNNDFCGEKGNAMAVGHVVTMTVDAISKTGEEKERERQRGWGGYGLAEGTAMVDESAEGSAATCATRLTVVTNDEMRNHRMALLEPVPFKRWRDSHVRGFHFPFVASNANSSSGSNEMNAQECGGSPLHPTGRVPAPAPVLFSAPVFTRYMQVVRGAWHVPIREADGGAGSKWLCVNLRAGLAAEDARRRSGQQGKR